MPSWLTIVGLTLAASVKSVSSYPAGNEANEGALASPSEVHYHPGLSGSPLSPSNYKLDPDFMDYLWSELGVNDEGQSSHVGPEADTSHDYWPHPHMVDDHFVSTHGSNPFSNFHAPSHHTFQPGQLDAPSVNDLLSGGSAVQLESASGSQPATKPQKVLHVAAAQRQLSIVPAEAQRLEKALLSSHRANTAQATDHGTSSGQVHPPLQDNRETDVSISRAEAAQKASTWFSQHSPIQISSVSSDDRNIQSLGHAQDFESITTTSSDTPNRPGIIKVPQDMARPTVGKKRRRKGKDTLWHRKLPQQIKSLESSTPPFERGLRERVPYMWLDSAAMKNFINTKYFAGKLHWVSQDTLPKSTKNMYRGASLQASRLLPDTGSFPIALKPNQGIIRGIRMTTHGGKFAHAPHTQDQTFDKSRVLYSFWGVPEGRKGLSQGPIFNYGTGYIELSDFDDVDAHLEKLKADLKKITEVVSEKGGQVTEGSRVHI